MDVGCVGGQTTELVEEGDGIRFSGGGAAQEPTAHLDEALRVRRVRSDIPPRGFARTALHQELDGARRFGVEPLVDTLGFEPPDSGAGHASVLPADERRPEARMGGDDERIRRYATQDHGPRPERRFHEK